VKRDETKQGELFPPLPRDEARAWLARALIAAFPHETQADADLKRLEEWGDSLFYIAEHFKIPDHALIWWVRDQPKGKDWSLTAWREHCEKYAAAAAQLPPEAVEAAQATPDARETARAAPLAMCQTCFANVVQRIDGVWWCAKCGTARMGGEE